MRPMTWSGAGLVAVLASAALAGAAQAQPSWQCSASAVSDSLAGNPGANAGRGLRQPVRVQRDRARQPAHAARRPRQRRLGADLVGGDHRQPRERDRRASGRRRHRPRREPRRPAPARRGDDDARRPRRQRAGLRSLRRGLARARRLQRGDRSHHRRPGGPDRAGRTAALAAAGAAGRRRRPEARRAGAHRQLAVDQRAAPEGPLGGGHARARGDRRRGQRRPSAARSATRRARPRPARAATAPTAPTAMAATARPTAPAAGRSWPTACAAAPAAS